MTIRKTASLHFVASAVAFALLGCGGDTSSSSTPAVADVSLLPDGKVGAAGDLVNKAEYEAIACGMTKEQVMAVVVDQPTKVIGETLVWNNGNGTATISFSGVSFSGFVTTKTLSSATNSASPTITRC